MKKLFIFISIIIFQNLYSVEVHLKDGVVETITQQEDETLQRFSSVFADRPSELFELEVGKRILPEVKQDSFKILRKFFPLIEENTAKTYNAKEKKKFNKLTEDQKVALLNTADYLEIEQLSGLHEVFVEHMFDPKFVKKTFEDEHELQALKKRIEKLNPCFQSYLTGQEVFLKYQENIFNDLWQYYIEKYQKEIDIPEAPCELSWGPDGAIAISISKPAPDGYVKIIDDWENNVYWEKKCNQPEKIIWSPDGQLLLAHSSEYNYLNCAGKDFVAIKNIQFKDVSDFGWLNNKEFLISFDNGALARCDMRSSKLFRVDPLNNEPVDVRKIVIQPDCQKFVRFCTNAMTLYDTTNLEEISSIVFENHRTIVKASGGNIAAAAYRKNNDLYMYIWEKNELIQMNIEDNIKEIAWNPMGDRLAVATRKDIQVYDTALQMKDYFNNDEQPIYTLAWRNDECLVAGSGDKIFVWNQKQNKTQSIKDLASGVATNGCKYSMGFIDKIVLSPDTKHLAVVIKSKHVGWNNVYILPIFEAEDTFNSLDPLETLATCYFYNNYLLPSLSEARQEIINNLLQILGAKSVENYIKTAHKSFGPLEITRSKIESILKDQGKEDIKLGKQEE